MAAPLELTKRNGECLTELEAVNAYLLPQGIQFWPLDLANLPGPVRAALDRDKMSEQEAALIKAFFLLSRERLLELIAACGREPHVSGGGALETRVLPHDYTYPILLQITSEEPLTLYDQLHCNQASDGTGVDEVIQFFRGSGCYLRHRLPDGTEWEMTLSCPSDEQGWLFTYSGQHPHLASPGKCSPGSKFLVQVIGPPVWTMEYVE